MKKVNAILIVLLTLSLVACSTVTPPPPSPVQLAEEVVFYDWDADIPQAVLDAFAAEFGVQVRYEVYESQTEAIENMRAGEQFDVVVMDSHWIPMLVEEGLVAELDYANLPNARNLSANFRHLAYDPDNLHSIPFNWGTTGLLVRSDLVGEPVTSWNALFDPRYTGKVGIWVDMPRETIAAALKSLGYSANSENPAELEAALARLLKLSPHALILEDYDDVTSAGVINSGQAVIALAWALDVFEAHSDDLSPAVYVLPEEGALMWTDAFVVPSNSPNKYTAEVFLNFLLRPEIAAQIVHFNNYATANEAALAHIDEELLNDPVIFPPNADLLNAEIILPLSPLVEELYDAVWARFLEAIP